MPWDSPPQTFLTGNTAGTTHVFGPSVTLSGGPNITLSGAGNKIVISGGAGGSGAAAATLSQFVNAYRGAGVQVAWGTQHGTMFVGEVYPGDFFPGQMTVSTVFLAYQGASNASMSAARTYNVNLGFYTLNQAASGLSLASSASTALTNNADANASVSWHGGRYITFDQSLFPGSSVAFSNTSYWAAVVLLTAGSSMNVSLQGVDAAAGVGLWGTAGVTATSTLSQAKYAPWFGAYTASTSALPASIGTGDLTLLGAHGFAPRMVFHNSMSSF